MIDTIVIVMMENRSFDHMLGHLSFEHLKAGVDGLTGNLNDGRYTNVHDGKAFNPFVRPDAPLPFDVPHEADDVAVQMGVKNAGSFTMDGFVDAYAAANGPVFATQTEPMAFCASRDVPVTSFLARNFCPCDRWFSAIPSSTQPNKSIAMMGTSESFLTVNRLIRAGNRTLPEWLESQGIRWRIYTESVSFFLLYADKLELGLPPNARSTRGMLRDFKLEDDTTFPQVVIVEPGYSSVAFVPGFPANDNHAPLAVGPGEEFLWRVYTAVTANPSRWARTVMIVTYDEHGGFYDHVSPPDVHFTIDGREFSSLGPRVPSIIVSPFTRPTDVCKATLDHTSILQFVGEVFAGDAGAVSKFLAERIDQGVESAGVALTLDEAVSDPPPAPPDPPDHTALLHARRDPQDAMQSAFKAAADRLLERRPDVVLEDYPELVEWKHTDP